MSDIEVNQMMWSEELDVIYVFEFGNFGENCESAVVSKVLARIWVLEWQLSCGLGEIVMACLVSSSKMLGK